MKYKIFTLIMTTAALLSAAEPVIERDGNYTTVTVIENINTDKSPYQLEISDVIAEIIIRGGSDNMIKFREKFIVKTDSRNEAEEIWEKYHLSLKRSDYGHALKNDSFKRLKSDAGLKVEYLLEIPTKSSVAAKTFAGDILLENTAGEMVMATYGGDISARKVSGSLNFSTAGGDIHAELLEGNIRLFSAAGDISSKHSKGVSDIETAGGDIDITDHQGNLKANTYGGDIDLRRAKGETIELNTMGGDIKVRDSKAEIVMETAGGDLNVEDVEGSVKGETMGGAIDCRRIRGPLNMQTAGGDIDAEDIYGSASLETSFGDIRFEKIWSESVEIHDISLYTDNGNIDLTVPDLPEFNLDAKARGYGVRIISDFPLEFVQKDNRKVVASFRSNEEAYLIDLTAEQGDITIRKGK